MTQKEFFVPGHITGFFQIFEHKEFLKAGSRGCGIVIDKGVRTTACVEDIEGDKNRIKIYLNKKPCSCSTSKVAGEIMLANTCGSYSIEITHEAELPVSQGFGTSAAGAIGTALALNRELKQGLTFEQIGRVAHASEVASKTGLGSVIAEMNGGMVIRKKEGAPGIGKIDKIEANGHVVCFITGEKILTSDVLKDEEKTRKINDAGRICMEKILKEQSIENFLKVSKFFTIETGLYNKETLKLIKKLGSEGITAAMCMLGNAVFTISDEPEKVIEKACINEKNTITARIRNEAVEV